MLNTNNTKNLATVCKVTSRISQAVISGWLVGFSDFQRIHRFGSHIAERFLILQKKAHSLLDVLFVSCFADFKVKFMIITQGHSILKNRLKTKADQNFLHAIRRDHL